MLADALDGTLSTKDQAAFDLHMAGCNTCAAMLADAQRGAAWMEMLKSFPPEPPDALLKRIFAETCDKATNESRPAIVLGGNDHLRVPDVLLPHAPTHATIAPAKNVLPFPARVTHGLRSFGQAILQPRFAMTAAMAFFSIALTMNLTGIHLRDLHASDLKPSSIMRSCYDAKARVVRYSDNLRVVYELESRVRDLQNSPNSDFSNSNPAPQSTPASTNPQQNPSNTNQPDSQNPVPRNPDQKQNRPKPGPGSSRRESPDGNLLRAPHHRGTQFASMQSLVVFSPSVTRKEGGLV